MDDAREYRRRDARSLKNEFQSSFCASDRAADGDDAVEFARRPLVVFRSMGESGIIVVAVWGRHVVFNVVVGLRIVREEEKEGEALLSCVDTGRVC